MSLIFTCSLCLCLSLSFLSLFGFFGRRWLGSRIDILIAFCLLPFSFFFFPFLSHLPQLLLLFVCQLNALFHYADFFHLLLSFMESVLQFFLSRPFTLSFVDSTQILLLLLLFAKLVQFLISHQVYLVLLVECDFKVHDRTDLFESRCVEVGFKLSSKCAFKKAQNCFLSCVFLPLC